MTRPKTRTVQLRPDCMSDMKARFGTLKNAFRVLAPVGMTQDVFVRVAAGRFSLPGEVLAVQLALAAWKKANLK